MLFSKDKKAATQILLMEIPMVKTRLSVGPLKGLTAANVWWRHAVRLDSVVCTEYGDKKKGLGKRARDKLY
jgi:hypothetical protein